jgi:RNA polymerase sigma factor (sigma-70 family)
MLTSLKGGSMLKVNRKGKARGFSHYLSGKIPDRIDVTDLVVRLRAGDLTVKDELIRHHIRTALSITAWFVGKADLEDLVSEAMLAVVEAVERAQQKLRDNNITPFIRSNVRGKLARFIDAESGLSERQLYKNGVPRPKRVEMPERSARESDLLQVILDLCSDNREREIVMLKSQYYNDTEVGEMVGLSRQRVGQILSDLEERYGR